MADPFLAEIRIFGFEFAPSNWALCNGQVMSISQNTALFSLLGTTYGGNGQSTFALPNLQGQAPMHPGQGNGLTPRGLGDVIGSETVSLIQSEIPAHTHGVSASTALAITTNPSNAVIARAQNGLPYTAASNLIPLHQSSMSASGSGLPHNNMQPYLVMNYCIALQGTYPPRN